MTIKRRMTIMNITLVMLAAGLFFYGDAVLFTLVYFAEFLFVSFRAIQSTGRKRTRALLIVTYFVVMALQIIFYIHIVAGGDFWMDHPIRKLFAVALLLLPMTISRYVAVNKYTELYLPTIEEAATISFSQLGELAEKVKEAAKKLEKTRGSLTPGNFKEIVNDLPRHDSFRYINAGSLTDEYFRAAGASLDDPGLYIIVSDTRTAASEIISVFTSKQFNHASLAFDAALETIVSYNGGVRVYQPGLNPEMIEFLGKNEDASVLVYRLPVTREQKQAALEKIADINREGSAYNMLGLVIGHSYRPNIMYCSQFVYKLLEHIGAVYFEAGGVIKPTDLIEKDYFRRLEFIGELRLRGAPQKTGQ